MEPLVLRGHLPGPIGEAPRRVNQNRSELLRQILQDCFAGSVPSHAAQRSRSRQTFQLGPSG